MLQALLPSIGWYVVFSFFVFHQQLHAKKFQGGSQGYALLLSVFGLTGMIIGLAYLGVLAYRAAWWAPLPAFIMGTLIAGLGSGLLARSAGRIAIISLIGFAAWPVSAYFMFQAIPGSG